MKVAAIANAMEQYEYKKAKLNKSQADLDEYAFMDLAYGIDEKLVEKQKLIVQKDEEELAELLNADISKVPLIHPCFVLNNTRKKGLIFNRRA